jgi:hypothetical protein
MFTVMRLGPKGLLYDPKPKDFIGRRGTVQFFNQLPTMLQLFELFWPFTTLRRIVEETNCYATVVIDAFGNTWGRGVNGRN